MCRFQQLSLVAAFALTISAAVLMLGLQTANAEVITDLGSYVLFATGNGVPLNDTVLSLKGGNADGRGLVYGGNVGVNKADPKLNNDPAMIAVGLNGKFIMQSGYQLVGDSIRLGVEAVVYDVYTNKQVGTGWGTPGVVNGTISTFTAPLFDPMPPLFDPFSTSSITDIDVAKGTIYSGGSPLAPGEYRDLLVQDGATIYLTAGTYTFRRLNTGQSFNIFTVPGTIVQVTGDTDSNTLDMQFNGNGSFVGSAIQGVESVAMFRYLGTDVNFSDNSTFYGVILAPDAQISLGRAMDHYGRFIGGGFNSDFNDNIYYRDCTPVPEPSSCMLLITAGLGLFVCARRRGFAVLMMLILVLVLVETVSADMSSVSSSPLSDFVIFSGGGLSSSGGDETSIGGHTAITGNIGSNQDLFMQGNPLTGYPAQLDGSAYAGGNLTFGQDLTVGSSSGPLREVVANGAASIGGGADIYGNLYGDAITLGQLTGIRKVGGIGGNVEYTTSYIANDNAVVEGTVSSPSTKTFGLITMPTATVFTAGGANQTVPTGQGNSLTLVAGTYGALSTSSQNQSVVLSSGNYYFDEITTQGGFSLKIDLTAGNPVNIYVVGDADFAGQQTLLVKGTGTGDAFVSIDQSPQLAGLIYLETHAKFTMTGGVDKTHNIWGGTIYASLLESTSAEINIGQYTDWYGAAYAFDSFDVADHGTWTHIKLVPEPSALVLLGISAISLLAYVSRRRRS